MSKRMKHIIIATSLITTFGFHTNARAEPTPVNIAPKVYKVGELAIIRTPLPIGAVDLPTFKNYWKADDAGDTHSAAAFIMSGKMISLNQNTKVLVLEANSHYLKVRIRDEKHDIKNHNRIFWIKPIELISTNKTAVEQFRENMKRFK